MLCPQPSRACGYSGFSFDLGAAGRLDSRRLFRALGRAPVGNAPAGVPVWVRNKLYSTAAIAARCTRSPRSAGSTPRRPRGAEILHVDAAAARAQRQHPGVMATTSAIRECIDRSGYLFRTLKIPTSWAPGITAGFANGGFFPEMSRGRGAAPLGRTL